jgi:DNA-binding transcriptional LysR family regulator
LIAQGDVGTELLERYPFIQFHPDTYAEQQIDALLLDRGIKVELRMNLDSLEAIVKMAANGLWESIVPQRTTEQSFPAAIKVIPFGVSPVKRVVGVVKRISSPKREFIQILTAALIDQS